MNAFRTGLGCAVGLATSSPSADSGTGRRARLQVRRFGNGRHTMRNERFMSKSFTEFGLA